VEHVLLREGKGSDHAIAIDGKEASGTVTT
jgi:hypothetical protein